MDTNKENYIKEQARLFNLHKESLLPEYENKYVLFENGKVLDSGRDRVK